MEVKKLDKEKILTDLFENDFAEYEFKLFDKYPVKIRTVTAEAQLDIEKTMTDTRGSQLYMLHDYGLNLLSHTVISYNKKSFSDQAEAYAHLKKLPGTIIDALIKVVQAFEKAISAMAVPDNIDEVFFGIPSTEQGSVPSSTESNSVDEGVSEKQS